MSDDTMPDDTFATLTPLNPLARLAFSEVYETLISSPQNSLSDGAQAALSRMAVDGEQVFDKDVLHLRLEMEKKLFHNDGDGDISESPTEPDTDTEQLHQNLGMIWVGRYSLAFDSTPLEEERGWKIGKGPTEKVPMDLLLCTRSYAKWHEINLRNPHARINFDTQTRSLYIIGCSRSMLAQLTVNGEAVPRRPHHLNQHTMKVRLDKLEYDFRWTDYAATKEYVGERGKYVIRALHGPTIPMIDMPTPSPNQTTIGKWTLGKPLGKGARGRVFFGSDSSGDIAAIKLVERTSQNCGPVDEEVKILQEVTNLASKSDDNERILRMVDVIYPNQETFPSKAPFDHVAMVLKPMAHQTLLALVRVASRGERSNRGSKGMTMEAASVFRDALEGVKVMHDAGWLHRDLKPANIGIIGTPPRGVLLDLGMAMKLQVGGSLPPEPCTVGTINYLAPELEMINYDHSIDIWSMGVILYELTYGVHPWKFASNPWCNAKVSQEVRLAFENSYHTAMKTMRVDASRARASPTDGYIHLGALFAEMVRHRYVENNNLRRPDINEVLAHPAWGSLLPDTSQVKRQRLGDEP
ncbi:kinase-like domain-containing protein [Nemania abortiva]|nr:kinase-like domain-containing protein [Nemania abortiva]